MLICFERNGCWFRCAAVLFQKVKWSNDKASVTQEASRRVFSQPGSGNPKPVLINPLKLLHDALMAPILIQSSSDHHDSKFGLSRCRILDLSLFLLTRTGEPRLSQTRGNQISIKTAIPPSFKVTVIKAEAVGNWNFYFIYFFWRPFSPYVIIKNSTAAGNKSTSFHINVCCSLNTTLKTK